MSLFQTETARCPFCRGTLTFQVVYSVNADRRPDLRAQIIDGSFQRETCADCGKPMRMQPDFAYLDVRRGQWILVEPSSRLASWSELEDVARLTFAAGYGERANGIARVLGRALSPRVTFGWAALREKLVCRDAELEDVALECTKLLLLRGVGEMPLADGVDLRLVEVTEDELVFGWMHTADEVVLEGLSAPRTLYDGVVADDTGWAAVRVELAAGTYVDVNRLLMPVAAQG